MTPAFGGQYSIQLSYGRVGALFYAIPSLTPAAKDQPDVESGDYQRGNSTSLRPS